MTYYVEAAPFNGPDDDDSVMAWVDITAWVNDNLAPVTYSSGRQTELQAVDPGRFTFTLNNPDHRFTPGNPLSPYNPTVFAQMNSNPNFEVTADPWTAFNGATISRNAMQAHEGFYSLQIIPDGITAVPGTQSEEVSVMAGNTYRVVGWLWSLLGRSTLRIGITWFDASHAFISNSLVNSVLLAATWKKLGPVDFVAPGGAAFAKFLSSDSGTPAASNGWRLDQGQLIDPTAFGSHAITDQPDLTGWGTAMRIRLRETIGNTTIIHSDGNMLQPDLTISTPGVDQTVAVNVVDRIARLGSAPKFISTLTEYIRFHGGSALKAYWSMNDATQPPWRSLAPTGTPNSLELVKIKDTALVAPMGGVASIAPRSSVVASGDDVSNALFTQVYSGTTLVDGSGVHAANGLSPSIDLPDDQVMTIVMWMKPSAFMSTVSLVDVFDMVLLDGSFFDIKISYDVDKIWRCTVSGGALTGTIIGPFATLDRALPFVIRYGRNPKVFEFWINKLQIVGSLTGASPGSTTVSGLVGAPTPAYSGLFGHLQIYVGAPTDFDFDDYSAQLDVAYNGLEQQLAGQRITTAAQFAGMSATDLAIDQGTALMQRASLAGKTPLQVMQEAADTDQGLLHANGRKLIFHSRKRRYDL